MSSQQPCEGSLSERAGACPGLHSCSMIKVRTQAWASRSLWPLLSPCSIVSCHISVCTLGLQDSVFSALGRGQSRGSASMRPQGLQTAPFESGVPPCTRAPELGFRTLSVNHSIYKWLSSNSLELTWPGDTNMGYNVSKTVGPQGALSLVEEAESPPSSDRVGSASGRCTREMLGAQRRSPRPAGESGRPPGGGETELSLKG